MLPSSCSGCFVVISCFGYSFFGENGVQSLLGFLLEVIISREGFLVLGWRDNSSVCVEGRVKDGNGR